MIEGGSFSINSTGPVNKTVDTVFTPGFGISSYTYMVYKDDVVISSETVSDNSPVTISLSASGKYHIVVKLTDVSGKVTNKTSGTYVIDKEAPIINVSENSINMYKGDKVLFNEGVTAYDNMSGDLTGSVTNNASELDLNTVGTHQLVYTVSDEAGNKSVKSVDINVIGTSFHLFVLQMIIVICLIITGYIMLRFLRMLKLEKRIEPFVVLPIKDKTESVFDKFVKVYHRWNAFVVRILKKSVVLVKYSKRFDKYNKVSILHKDGLSILAGKITVSLLFVIIAIFAKTIKLKLMGSYEMLLPLVVGFFLLDVLYFFKYKHYRSKISNDFLSAIIIMNNAFKSGRSITQAIDIVSSEIPSVIGREFKKMSLELSYGLGIEDVFKRFASRVDLDEVNYLTASLTILNKTGGNIVEVFSSIEKTLFNKKKLRLELKSLTASSRLIVYVLLLVPFLFVLFVSLITPDYFLPFVTTRFGIILMICMIIYYIIFVICVRKIMKVVI